MSKFETRWFELAHGRKPRGYGNWAFKPEAPQEEVTEWIVWANGTYTEAKREVAAKYPAVSRWLVLQ